jgi:hypothetical protein
VAITEVAVVVTVVEVVIAAVPTVVVAVTVVAAITVEARNNLYLWRMRLSFLNTGRDLKSVDSKWFRHE